MGDVSTHLIQFYEYWHLVYEVDNIWYTSEDGTRICEVGEEDKILELSELS